MISDTSTPSLARAPQEQLKLPLTHAQRYAHSRAQRANLLKQQLIEFLGGRCEECGATHDLQVNHIYQRDWQPRKLTHYRRVLRYWKEALAGEVNVLCEECNGRYRPLPREAGSKGEAAATAAANDAAVCPF